MKKTIKRILCGVAVLFSATFVFAGDFDWSKCWCNYGGGLKEGNVIINAGAGINWDIAPRVDENARNWFFPATEVSVEVPVKIWKLPFSFGGSLSYDSHGNDYKINEFDYSQHRISTGAMVKYHVQLPPKNLDVYAGQKAGFGMILWPHTNGFQLDFYHAEIIGATWYFNDTLGVNLEFGYPIAVKGGITLKF